MGEHNGLSGDHFEAVNQRHYTAWLYLWFSSVVYRCGSVFEQQRLDARRAVAFSTGHIFWPL